MVETPQRGEQAKAARDSLSDLTSLGPCGSCFCPSPFLTFWIEKNFGLSKSMCRSNTEACPSLQGKYIYAQLFVWAVDSLNQTLKA